jgi:hypothetical protein
MTNAPALFRSLIVYAICLPVAVILGYLLATPLDFTSLGVEVIVLCVLAVPLLLRWHHIMLIAAWNSTAVLFLVPGKPPVWILLAGVSLGLSILRYALNRNLRLLPARSITWPVLFLVAVVLITARLTGGISLRVLGSETHGGKNYITILAAVIGYFAIIGQPIPSRRAGLCVGLFFLGLGTVAIANLAGVINPKFNFLFLVFPVGSLDVFTEQNSMVGQTGFVPRLFGLAPLGLAVYCLMLARYGIRGVLEATKPWRLGVLCLAVLVSMMGGYRSTSILLILAFALLFYLEGLHRTRLLLPIVLALLVGGCLVTLFAARLPYPIQRSLAFLPIPLDPIVRFDAESSTAWRVQMWKDVLPEVPRYLLRGKGYSFSATDQWLARGLEGTEVVGNYHNGPLSVIIPFGIFGAIAFLWLVFAGIRVVYRNCRFGDPGLHNINAFMYAYFVAKVIFFFTIFGSLHSDLPMFLGLLGLSISLNGGVAQPAVEP